MVARTSHFRYNTQCAYVAVWYNNYNIIFVLAEARLEEQLKVREDELNALNEERDRLLSRVSLLEGENSRFEKESNSSQVHCIMMGGVCER